MGSGNSKLCGCKPPHTVYKRDSFGTGEKDNDDGDTPPFFTPSLPPYSANKKNTNTNTDTNEPGCEGDEFLKLTRSPPPSYMYPSSAAAASAGTGDLISSTTLRFEPFDLANHKVSKSKNPRVRLWVTVTIWDVKATAIRGSAKLNQPVPGSKTWDFERYARETMPIVTCYESTKRGLMVYIGKKSYYKISQPSPGNTVSAKHFHWSEDARETPYKIEVRTISDRSWVITDGVVTTSGESRVPLFREPKPVPFP